MYGDMQRSCHVSEVPQSGCISPLTKSPQTEHKLDPVVTESVS